ncbi:MAG: four helix bundle protein [Treponema sp.]|nr:four helix bundle protein [Treponema sp.]
MQIVDYKELIIWQKSMDLVSEVYKLAKKLPKEETYVLSDQIRRSAISIPSNIAEGNGRHSVKEYGYFLSIARGSIAELETQLLLGERIGYWESKDLTQSFDLITEIRKMLTKIKHNLAIKE